MNEKTVEIDIPLLLPELESARDACVHRLEQELEYRRGVLRTHVKYNGDPAQLCIHYDPELVSLAAVKRIARDAGAELTDRYPHKTIPFAGLDAADVADTLGDELGELPGMLHARVNYAAGLAFVAYDREALSLRQIVETMQDLGADARLPGEIVTRGEAKPAEEAAHDHGLVPSFLPHWMQERWRMIVVGLAGVFFLSGWIGGTFLELPEPVALAFFLLAYVFGGYDIATHAIPGLLRGRFDTDVLMLAAAGGQRCWGSGRRARFCFSSSAWLTWASTMRWTGHGRRSMRWAS